MNFDVNMFDNDALATLIGGSIIVLLVLGLLAITFLVFYLIGLVKLFKKAGRKGWEAIIPFYNFYVLIQIAGLNWWYFLIAISGSVLSAFNSNDSALLNFLTTAASAFVNFLVFYNIAKKMHKSPVGFGVASIFVESIVVMILGFSKDCQYDNSVSVCPNGPIGEDKTATESQNSPERYCLGCGQKLKDGVQFCENCGKKVE